MSKKAPPMWWWLGLAAMALLFALLRVMLEMHSGAAAVGSEVESTVGAAGGELTGVGISGLGALDALLRSCVPPSGAGAEEWWLWAFFMADIGLMGFASLMAIWFYARPKLSGLGAAARIPLEDEARA